MIVGVGIDLLNVQRIRRLVKRGKGNRLAQRILSNDEICHPDAYTVDFLALRWAVKEAAYKALFPSLKLTWKEISVLKDSGKPYIYLNSHIKYSSLYSHTSVSHDGDFLVAQVIFEKST